MATVKDAGADLKWDAKGAIDLSPTCGRGEAKMKNNSQMTGALIIACLLVGLLVVVAIENASQKPSLQVEVSNLADCQLNDVVVFCSGVDYSFHELASNSKRSLRISPNSASGFELRYTLPDGRRKSFDLGGYVEPGYTGVVTITVKSEAAPTLDEEYRLRN